MNQREHFMGNAGEDYLFGGTNTGTEAWEESSTQILDGGSGNDVIIGGDSSYD
jgi:Ca2+-binding RTX toxin-like protein